MRVRVLAPLTLTTMLLAGCGAGRVLPPSPQPGVALRGVVHGGQQAVVGAHVYLMAANTTGYGGNGIAASSANASVSLLNAASTGYSDSIGAYVPTAADGSFAITGDYTCTPGQQVYLYGLGGNPGAGGINAAAGFLAVLGNCPSGGSFATSTPYVYMNEVTTVTAAYVMAPFATDATHVSSSGTALAQTGIANAFANAANLVNIATGQAPTATPAGNGTVPDSTIYTLANILAACINAPNSGSAGCSTLLSTATADGTPSGANPTDTASAAINIAHHPGANIATLYSITSSTPPFGGALSTQPNDFTLSLNYTTDPSATATFDFAIDGSGNLWVIHQLYGGSSGAVTKLSATSGSMYGATVSPSSTFNAPEHIAIDTNGDPWVVNNGNNTLLKLNTSGSITNTYTGGGMNSPDGLAIDGSNNVWVVNITNPNNAYAGGSFSKFSSSGTPASSTVFTDSCLGSIGVTNIAFDSYGNAFIGTVGYCISKYNSSATLLSGSGYLQSSYGYGSLAVDGSNNLWVPNLDVNPGAMLEMSDSGTLMSGSGTGYSANDMSYADGTAIDGNGDIWTANYRNNVLTEFSNTGTVLSPANGYISVSSGYGSNMAIDGSGNIWVLSSNGQLTESVGLAAPVVTPLAANLASPYSHPASKP